MTQFLINKRDLAHVENGISGMCLFDLDFHVVLLVEVLGEQSSMVVRGKVVILIRSDSKQRNSSIVVHENRVLLGVADVRFLREFNTNTK